MAARSSNLPIEPVLVGLALFCLLGLFVAADPPMHATTSGSPFTDEGFNSVNARNFVQLGRWSTDDWNLYLVNLPFSLMLAGVFELLGTGIVQARLAAITCTALTAAAIAWGLRPIVGRSLALLGSLAFAGSGLILLYGRMVYLEDLVVLALTVGTLILVRQGTWSIRWGFLAGLCLAIAIGAKPNSATSVAGVLLALALVCGRRDRAILRALGGAVAAIGLAGFLWAAIIWLPNQSAVAADLRIWAPVRLAFAPGDIWHTASLYLIGQNDHLYGRLLGPLLGLAAAGAIAAFVLRGRLTEAEARLAAASFGWAAFGFALLADSNYRPSRYVVPLVPALALLACVGLSVTGRCLTERLRARSETSDAPGAAPLTRRIERVATPLLATIAIVVAVLPGLTLYASWVRHASYELPPAQQRFATQVADADRVAGALAPLFLMQSRAITMVTQGTAANGGDLYGAGVRLYVTAADAAAPNSVPASSWSKRQALDCISWGGVRNCLFRVP